MIGHDIWGELSRGGYTLAVIIVCSLLALAVAAERIIASWGIVAEARQLADQVTKALLRGDQAQARTLCERSRSVVGDLFLAGFARRGQGAKDFEQAVERERLTLLLRLKANLWILGTLGTISPFIGLFGTVVGIRNAFAAMAAAGTGGFAVVAVGISEALVCTAAGIFVAVEAVVLYNYFQARLGRVSSQIKLISDEFIEILNERPDLESREPTSEPTPAPAPTAGV
jgi:biopolymer transport protein ExbB